MSDTVKIANYSGGDSISLKEIDGEYFTIVDVERSDYESNLGIIFTTEELVKGANRFHTTRKAIVGQFLAQNEDTKEVTRKELFDVIKSGKKLCVRTKEIEQPKGKNNYFILEDKEDGLKESE